MNEADKLTLDFVRESLERSEAQIATGQTAPLESVLERLRASIHRIKATAGEPSRITAFKA